MEGNSTRQLRLEDLDLQGYTLQERLEGIALMQDPIRADIIRFAAQELERVTTQLDAELKLRRDNYND